MRAEILTEDGTEIEMGRDRFSDELHVQYYLPSIGEGGSFDLSRADIDELIQALTALRDA